MQLLSTSYDIGQIQHFHHTAENVGQHVAWNDAFAYAVEHKYDYFVRVDDDCEFTSKRWLAKLVQISQDLEDKFILSPTISGLKHQPLKSDAIKEGEWTLQFAHEAIGGVCRFHPVALLYAHNFVADVRKPLGSGDATGIASWCRENIIMMAYVKEIRVKHATRKQEAADKSHFLSHSIFQHIPYIPLGDSLCETPLTK
jgi:glycosyltransferase involved in cell wall biosynthesis